jgi:hypothetical protein
MKYVLAAVLRFLAIWFGSMAFLHSVTQKTPSGPVLTDLVIGSLYAAVSLTVASAWEREC